ncbi:hypothetical protein B0H11DRAFT_2040862 [Mycena galericulata]|nr:hypothetical protein B0H11DRAFT_2040862 [Mycena galericulata]
MPQHTYSRSGEQTSARYRPYRDQLISPTMADTTEAYTFADMFDSTVALPQSTLDAFNATPEEYLPGRLSLGRSVMLKYALESLAEGVGGIPCGILTIWRQRLVDNVQNNILLASAYPLHRRGVDAQHLFHVLIGTMFGNGAGAQATADWIHQLLSPAIRRARAEPTNEDNRGPSAWPQNRQSAVLNRLEELNAISMAQLRRADNPYTLPTAAHDDTNSPLSFFTAQHILYQPTAATQAPRLGKRRRSSSTGRRPLADLITSVQAPDGFPGDGRALFASMPSSAR